MKLLLTLFTLALSLNQISAQQKDIKLDNNGIIIAGTYSKSEGSNEKPLIIMLSGSGAQTRESEIVGYPVFKTLSEEFNLNGYSTFRFDDRGVGLSTGDFDATTLEDFVSDISAIINYFTMSEELQHTSFILAGHSLGGVISIKAATIDERISSILLLASPSLPLYEIINEQIRSTQRLMGHSEESLNEALEFQALIYDAVKDSAKWKIVKSIFTERMKNRIAELPQERQNQIPDIDAFINMRYQQSIVNQVRTRQMESLLFYDPAEDLRKIEVPVAIILGGNDVQVKQEKNLETYEQVCHSSSLECLISVKEKMNHLFQEAETGLVQEYASLPHELSEGFIRSLIASLEFIEQ